MRLRSSEILHLIKPLIYYFVKSSSAAIIALLYRWSLLQMSMLSPSTSSGRTVV